MLGWLFANRVSHGIRAGTVNISEDYFLRCFYPYGKGDPDNVERGFLRSSLLIKVCSIVTMLFPSLCSTSILEDIFKHLYITFFIGIFRWGGRKWNSEKKATNIRFAEKGNQVQCCKPYWHGWSSYSTIHCLCCCPCMSDNSPCFLSNSLIAILSSLPSIWPMLAIGQKSTIYSISVHYMLWLSIFLRLRVERQHKIAQRICSNGGART